MYVMSKEDSYISDYCYQVCLNIPHDAGKWEDAMKAELYLLKEK